MERRGASIVDSGGNRSASMSLCVRLQHSELPHPHAVHFLRVTFANRGAAQNRPYCDGWFPALGSMQVHPAAKSRTRWRQINRLRCLAFDVFPLRFSFHRVQCLGFLSAVSAPRRSRNESTRGVQTRRRSAPMRFAPDSPSRRRAW